MAVTNTLSGNFSSDVSVYIAAKTLMLAKKMMVMYQICDKVPLPKNEGRTFQYSRYERLNLPQSALSEGVSPGGSSMSISTVSAVMDQWGDVVAVSDVAIDSVKHPVLNQAIELLSLQAAETMDREIIKVALSGTNVFFPGSVSARGSLSSSDKISSTVVGKIAAQLRSDGALPFDGQYFYGVIDPFIEDDMQNDQTFIDASKYGQIKNLLVGEVGAWKGVRWVRSNTLPAIKLLTGASAATNSGTSGSLSNGTAYDFKASIVDAKTGFETFMSAVFSATTGVSDTSIDVTLPALPAGATAGSTFKIYAGSSGGTLYLSSSGNAASAVVNVKSIPTSGDVAQAAPPSGFKVRLAFVIGKQALACIELNKMKAYLTKAESTDSDPLVQRRKAGWKADFKSVITNDLFMGRLEAASTNGG